jgi:predicted nucleotidyltransferase
MASPPPESEHPFPAIEQSLKKAVAGLRDAGIPFLLAGSLAVWARGGPETRHDLDFVLKREDAERALEVLADVGMRTEKPPEEWLYKAWDDDVLIDLIFHPRGLEVTDELIERGEFLHVLGITIPVMSIEDVLATKLLALMEHELDYTALVRIARAVREQIDWRYLRERTSDSPYAAAFFALCEELRVVPEEHVRQGAEVRLLGPSRAVSPQGR